MSANKDRDLLAALSAICEEMRLVVDDIGLRNYPAYETARALIADAGSDEQIRIIMRRGLHSEGTAEGAHWCDLLAAAKAAMPYLKAKYGVEQEVCDQMEIAIKSHRACGACDANMRPKPMPQA